MFRPLLAGLGLGGALCVLPCAQAQHPLPMAPTQSSPPVRIDGRLDDPAWQQAPVFDRFVRYRPDEQGDAGPFRTDVRVRVEPGALVFAIRAFDPEPALIRAPLSRRDQVWPDQDSVTVWIDAAGRGEHAQFVRVNAAGSVRDGLYSAAVDDEDEAPDFLEVEVATQRLADGYTVELRWPLAMLRYPLEGQRPWGLMLTRRVAREAASLASVPLSRDMPHLLTRLQPLAEGEGLSALQAQLQHARHALLRPELTLRRSEGRLRANLGLEAQWRPRADWVLDAIVRPDFSQVELDEPQFAGSTRFARFLPEKRAFFLESSDVVGAVAPDDWGVARGLLAFHSRSVHDPRVGLRATWRGGTQEATALLVRDAGGGSRLLPGPFGTESADDDAASTLFFARHRFQLGDGLALAPLLSLRERSGRDDGQLAGFDAQWSPSAAWQWRGHWLASHQRHGGGTERGHAQWLQARWREGDWRVQADWERLSPRFDSSNGFVPQRGIERRTLDLLHAWHPEQPWLSTIEALLRVSHTRALRDPESGLNASQTVSRALQPGTWMLGPAGTEFLLFRQFEEQRTRAGGALHRPRSWFFVLDTHPGARLTYLNLEGTVGERVDVDADRLGRGHQLSSALAWRQPLGSGGRNLEFEQRLGHGHVRSSSGRLDERTLQTKLLLHWNRTQALRLIWQQQRLQREGEAETRHRVGTLTWLQREGALKGWSVGAQWQREGAGAIQREVFVKYQPGWALGG